MGLKNSPSGAVSVLNAEARQMKQNSAGGLPPAPAGGGGGSDMGSSPKSATSNLKSQESHAPMRSTGQDCNPAGG